MLRVCAAKSRLYEHCRHRDSACSLIRALALQELEAAFNELKTLPKGKVCTESLHGRVCICWPSASMCRTMQAVYTEQSGLLFLSSKQDAQRRVAQALRDLKKQ